MFCFWNLQKYPRINKHFRQRLLKRWRRNESHKGLICLDEFIKTNSEQNIFLDYFVSPRSQKWSQHRKSTPSINKHFWQRLWKRWCRNKSHKGLICLDEFIKTNSEQNIFLDYFVSPRSQKWSQHRKSTPSINKHFWQRLLKRWCRNESHKGLICLDEFKKNKFWARYVFDNFVLPKVKNDPSIEETVNVLVLQVG